MMPKIILLLLSFWSQWLGGSQDVNSLPPPGKIGSIDGSVYLITSVKQTGKNPDYYTFYGVWLGKVEKQWNKSSDWKITPPK